MTNTKDALQAQKNALMEALKALRAIQTTADFSDQQNAEMNEVEMDVLSAATRLSQLISKMD